MLKSFFKNHIEIIQTFKDRYKLISFYLCIVIFLGLSESFGIALLFPIAELIQNQEVINQYIIIFYNYTGYKISGENLILMIFMAAFFLFIAAGISQIISFNIAARLTDGLYSLWQQMIFSRYLNSKYSFFIENMSGDLVQRLVLHTEKAVQVVQHLCIIIKELILMGFIVLVLTSLSIKLTLLLITVGVLFTFVSIIFGKLNIFKAANNVAIHQQNAVSIAAESINSIKLIKAYSLEKIINSKFAHEISKRAKYLIYNQSFVNVPGVILRTLTLIIMLSALLFIAKSNFDNSSQIISFLVLFAGAGYRINGSIGAMNNSFLSLANVIPSLQIISNELNYEIKKIETIQIQDEKYKFNKLIEFDKVFFSYKKGTKKILSDINLQLIKGKLVGIVGESGSGKSTLIDLILKLYEPSEGNIYIDNKNLKSLNKKQWRNTLGYVGQETQILSGTIYSNITLNFEFDLDEDADVKESIRISDIEDFVMGLPDKLKTKINENGDNISAGQKQRIAISRAIYFNPDILLFDEATSNLNPSSEKKIFYNLRKFCKKNETTLIHVTHRVDLLSELDEIIFIKDGKIIGQGKHNNLLSESNEYSDFIGKVRR